MARTGAGAPSGWPCPSSPTSPRGIGIRVTRIPNWPSASLRAKARDAPRRGKVEPCSPGISSPSSGPSARPTSSRPARRRANSGPVFEAFVSNGRSSISRPGRCPAPERSTRDSPPRGLARSLSPPRDWYSRCHGGHTLCSCIRHAPGLSPGSSSCPRRWRCRPACTLRPRSSPPARSAGCGTTCPISARACTRRRRPFPGHIRIIMRPGSISRATSGSSALTGRPTGHDRAGSPAGHARPPYGAAALP